MADRESRKCGGSVGPSERCWLGGSDCEGTCRGLQDIATWGRPIFDPMDIRRMAHSSQTHHYSSFGSTGAPTCRARVRPSAKSSQPHRCTSRPTKLSELPSACRMEHEEASDNDQPPFDPSLPPFDERVIAVVRAAPNHTLRPARLSSELGISVEDATAELCGLLRAVGGGEGGATFTFEEVGGDGGDDVDGGTAAKTAITMTFTFPPNFEARARRYKRTNDAKQTILSALDVAARALKVFVAFGLIISLAVLSVASIMAMVAALVALARGGGDGRQRSELMRKIRSLIFTLRQMLWCYAVFGPGLDSGHDPFLRQTAGDLWLVLSMFCGNPFSFGFWWRANMLNRRRRRWGQGWGSRHYAYDSASVGSDDEVVHLVSRGESGQQHDNNGRNGTNTVASTSADDEGYRGLLSVVVEFLFGPSPFPPGPTELERWKLRGAVIIALSSKASQQGVSLEELAPYSDNPPASLEDISSIVSEGLRVVSHFNGVPVLEGNDATTCSRSTTSSKARFIFPELMAEASMTTTANSFSHLYPDLSPFVWERMLYAKDSPHALGGNTNGSGNQRSLSMRDGFNACPDQLYEKYHVLTKLQSKQFGQCCLLGFLNFVGIFWLRQSIGRGGLLEISNRALYVTADGISAVLYFYSKLFFALPLARLVVFVVCCNYCFVRRRNERRAGVASELSCY